MFVVQENRKGHGGATGIHHVPVYVGELKAQGAERNGPVQSDIMAFVGSGLHYVPDAFVDNHFGDDVLTQGAFDVGGGGERGTAEEQLAVRIHGHKGEDLEGALDEGGSEQVVDAQGTAGRGARRVGAGAGKEAPDLVVVQDAAVPVVGHSDFIRLLHVGRGAVVAADPGGQARPRVGAHREHRPVEGLQGLVDPVHIEATVRAEKSVGHAELQHREPGARLEMDRLSDVEFERGVVSGDPLPGVHVDRRHAPFPSAEESAPRRLLGGRGVADLPSPLGIGPAGIHDPLGAGAAVDVLALSVANRAGPEQFARDLAQDGPHFRSQSVPPSACRTFRRGASGSG